MDNSKLFIVNPSGSKDSKITIVGEAPSVEEVRQGRPFVGRAGEKLDLLLLHSNISRGSCYITNVFKYMIQKKGEDIYKGEVKLFSNRTGTFTSDGMESVRELIEELKEIDSNVICLLGSVALSAVTGLKGIMKWRGSILWSDKIGKKVIPTIHPAALLRSYLQSYWVIWDLKRVKEESLTKELSLPERKYIIGPTFEECKAVLESYKKEKLLGFDIEVMNDEVSCLSFAKSPTEAICVPFIKGGSLYFNVEEEVIIWHLIGDILRDKNIRKVGQFFHFDISFIFNKYGIVIRNYDDTHILHKLIFPDYPAGLDFITSTRTREPYYKDEGKKHMKFGGTEENFWIYNCKDSMICVEALPSLFKDIDRLNNRTTYEVHRGLIEPTIFMGHKGIRVDVEAMERESVKTQIEIDKLQEELNTIVGYEMNPRSSKQVGNYFYIEKRLKPYQKGGRITTDEGALKRIARRGFKEAKLILDIRTLSHDISTYYSVKLKDNRLVCTYSPVTSMGRLSSSKDIFGYGTNMQNQPSSMNKFFIADEGYIIYNVDLSQADNRSVAYMGPEHRMIQAFEAGEDVHSLTASLIFNIPVNEIKQMHKEGVKCDIGYGDQTHRFWGKQCNHAFNFGRGYRSFAYDYEIPENEGKKLWEEYHKLYPGVQKNYHKWIIDKLAKDRILTNCFGRVYRFVERWGDTLFKQAYAFPAQSNTADIINRWGLIPLYYEPDFQHVELLRQVHDSINFQIPISKGIDYHTKVLLRLKALLEQKLVWRMTEFSIPAEFEIGKRLSEMTKIDFTKPLNEQLKGYFEIEKKEGLHGA
jgi:uracil-DNA glycosylase family 4